MKLSFGNKNIQKWNNYTHKVNNKYKLLKKRQKFNEINKTLKKGKIWF